MSTVLKSSFPPNHKHHKPKPVVSEKQFQGIFFTRPGSTMASIK